MAVGLLLMLLGGDRHGRGRLTQWGEHGLRRPSRPASTIRWVLVSTTSISLGFIIICAGLFSSLLTLRSARPGRLVFDDETEEALAAR